MTNQKKKKTQSNLTILIDSREQNPLPFRNSERTTLRTGDYSFACNGRSFASECCIERKSLPDLFSTLTSGHARFKRELQRAQSLKYFAIVVEGSYSDLVNRNFEFGFKAKTPGFVVGKILTKIHLKYGVPIWFAADRSDAMRLIHQLFDSYYSYACEGAKKQ